MRILVIEPNPKMRDAMVASLLRCGCEPPSIDEATEACVAHASEGYALVMVGADSLEEQGAACSHRSCLASQEWKGVVLAVTDNRDPEYVATLLDAGADDCLTPPIDGNRLAAMVALAKRRAVAARANDAVSLPLRPCMTRGPLAQDVPYGAFRSNAERGFLEVSQPLVRMLGYDSAEELLAADVSRDLYQNPSDREKLYARKDRYLRGEELAWKRKDGTPIVVRVSGRAARDEQGALIQFLGLAEDVTEKRLAQEHLRQSNEELTAIYNGMIDGILVTEGTTTPFIRANAAMCRLTGYSEEELLGLTVEDIHPKEALPDIRKRFGQMSKDPTIRAHGVPVLRKDGSVIHCDMAANYLTRQGQRYAIGFFRDVTEQREAEQALSESEETLRSLVENIPDLVLMLDDKWTVQYVNRETPVISAKELIGQSLIQYCQPEYRPRCEELMREALRTGAMQTLDILSTFDEWWSCRLVPMIERGETRNFMVIATDITQRKKAEREVRDEQELLRRLLDLFERDRELVAFEIHDGFSQQLTGALLNFEAAAESVKQVSARTARNFENGIRLLRESMAESRRLVRGLRPPVLDEYGIVPAIEHLIEDHLAGGGAKVDFASGVATRRLARPLESALFRIVQETLSNVRRHSHSPRARIELRQADGLVRLVVEDWGIGFDPDKVGTDHFGLRGIRERARLLGGRAEIKSAPNKGTRVSVELPMIEGTTMARPD